MGKDKNSLGICQKQSKWQDRIFAHVIAELYCVKEKTGPEEGLIK